MKLLPGKEQSYREYKKINSDPYGGAVVSYAEKWANLMEEAMASGISIKDCYQSLSHRADEEGITGFMYGCAVSGLAEFWEHGEELRKLHNAKYGVAPDKKGVVNPAIINLG